MSSVMIKSKTIQKPFRCTEELDVRINRTKGALMLRTGARISDNQFILDLLDLGLDVMHLRIENGFYEAVKQS